jgi:hypothetical protein
MMSYLAWSSKRVSHLISTHPSTMISIIRGSPSNQVIGMANTKFPRKEAKWVTSRDLVNMSACCLSVSVYFITMSPFSTWSLKKWYLTFMCLALLWKTGFWARHMALELSHLRGYALIGHSIISYGIHYPKDLRVTASSNYILNLSGGLCDERLFVSCNTLIFTRK